jgi:hypothetical protein
MGSALLLNLMAVKPRPGCRTDFPQRGRIVSKSGVQKLYFCKKAYCKKRLAKPFYSKTIFQIVSLLPEQTQNGLQSRFTVE